MIDIAIGSSVSTLSVAFVTSSHKGALLNAPVGAFGFLAGEEQSSKLTRNSFRFAVKKATPARLTLSCLRAGTLGFQSIPIEGSPADPAPARLLGLGV